MVWHENRWLTPTPKPTLSSVDKFHDFPWFFQGKEITDRLNIRAFWYIMRHQATSASLWNSYSRPAMRQLRVPDGDIALLQQKAFFLEPSFFYAAQNLLVIILEHVRDAGEIVAAGLTSGVKVDRNLVCARVVRQRPCILADILQGKPNANVLSSEWRRCEKRSVAVRLRQTISTRSPPISGPACTGRRLR